MQPPFDPDAGSPGYVYVKVADYLADRIADGTLPPGAMLPNERNLAAEHQIAVGTARRAVRLLRERGLVVTLPGLGTFITGRAVAQLLGMGSVATAAPARKPGEQ